MGHANGASEGREVTEFLLQNADASDGPDHAELARVNDGDASGVVAAILETLQAFENYGKRLP